MDKCQERPPSLLVQGVAEFNQGLYFECHETLETLWLRESDAVRELYQGILQVGVAFYKQKQGNYRGAVNLLRRGLTHLAPFSPSCQAVDVGRLIAEATRALSRLTDLGPARIAELEAHYLPRVQWVRQPDAGEPAPEDRTGSAIPGDHTVESR